MDFLRYFFFHLLLLPLEYSSGTFRFCMLDGLTGLNVVDSKINCTFCI